jgi:hypothetical protein
LLPTQLDMLRDLDRRVRLIEARLAAKPKRVRRRGPGRPPGSRNLPRIKIGKPLFEEPLRLETAEIAGKLVLERLLRQSEKHRARVLSAVIHDIEQWRPSLGNGSDSRSWRRLCALYAYTEARGELPALAEALKLVEGVPVDDVAAVKRGLALVAEFIAEPVAPAAEAA